GAVKAPACLHLRADSATLASGNLGNKSPAVGFGGYMSAWTRCLTLSSAIVLAAIMASPACAQIKLKWAHVYEITEPFHTEALWAASEIRKRSNGKFDIEVFPASQLGSEGQLNEGLGLGAVDIVYAGVNFVAATYKPLGITGAPFMLRD